MFSADALPLVEQVALGLHAAHQRGVIHGDLKPGNIMVTSAGGVARAKITDFGLARRQQGDSTVGSSHLMGTPSYMAPEQLAGGKPTIASDIYALGLVMYEMVTGAKPEFNRMNEPAPSPRIQAPDFDPKWESAILKCLLREPTNRFQTAGAVISAITGRACASLPPTQTITAPIFHRRRFALTSALAALLLAAGIASRHRIAHLFTRVPEVKHIAVIPFTNIGGAPANQAFCDGIAETLAGKLSQLERYQKSFWVVPTADVQISGAPTNLHHALGVNLLLTGSVQRLGDTVRLIVNLVNADTQRQLDSRTIDASASELPSLQDHVWSSAAAMLDLQLTPAARQSLLADATTVPGAYQFYLEGLGILRHPGLDNVDRAINRFQTALERDPSYAVALAGLGEAYAKKYELTRDVQWISLARSSGMRAAQLNPNLSPVHLTLGQIYFNIGQTEHAISELRTALDIDPAASQPYFWLGRAYEQQGKYEQAEASFKQLVSLRPDFWMGYNGFGWFYYRRGRLQDAASQFRAVTSLLPYSPVGYENLGGVYVLMGSYGDAVETLNRAITLQGSASAYSNLGAAYIMLRRYAEAVPVMERAVTLSPNDNRCWRNLGDAYNLVPGLSAKAPGAYQRAASLVEDELKIKPNDTEALSSAALYWAKLDDKYRALKQITRALELAPADNDVLFTSALVYELTGDRSAAIKAIKSAFNAGYPLEDINNAPELNRLRAAPEYLTWLKEKQRNSP